MHKLSIIIPCYNESRTIVEIIRRVLEAPLPGWEREVIVVDDGSTDGTRELLRSVDSSVTVLLQQKNGGKGTAMCAGLGRARGDYVITQDADLEYNPNEIQRLLSVIDAGVADVVYGSRNLSPQESEGSRVRRLGVWFLTLMINVLYQLHLTDICTCYKLFPREASSAVVPGGFESDILLAAALSRKGYRFAEVPISYSPRTVAEGKKIRLRDGLYAIIAITVDWLRHV